MLGVIIVGIAVAVGITMFQDNAINANRDAVSNDLVNLAARAQQYYRRPTGLGGGGNSFAGLTIAKLTNNATNDNGTYVITGTPDANGVVLTGTGKSMASDGSAVELTCTVSPTTYVLATTH
ncbi:MAG TPA: hypothetical protein VK470_01450 [Bacteroidota bacterium]|nr:hypothetical protein [Bacteroidota bacterium]